MKDIVLILSKTKMNHNQVCIGGLTLNGRYVRLIDENGNNQPDNTDLAPRQVLEIEFNDRPNNIPPHVEDVIVMNRTKKGILREDITIKDFIEKREIPIWRDSPDNLFDNLIQWTQSGSGFIDKNGGVPNHSVGFWVSNKDLRKKDFEGIRYQYPSETG